MRVVLIGAGHAHLYVAARAKQLIDLGAEVSLIDEDRFWYSGMATGVLGGMYPPDADQIDPQPLIEARGGRFLRDRVVAIDRASGHLHCASGTALAFDLLSLNVGSVIANQPAHGSERAWPVKPVSNLVHLRQHLEGHCAAGRTLNVVVIGGGATGCEVAANVEALVRRSRGSAVVTIVTTGTRVLQAQPEGASSLLAHLLTQRGIAVRTETAITRIDADAVRTAAGGRIRCDVAILATGLRAPSIVSQLQLPVDAGGYLRVRASLSTLGDPRIFATGDCAALEGHDLPKLGVFGVRAAPTLLHNLCSALNGTPRLYYHPQRRYLSVLNLGDGTALSLWGSLYWHSAWGLRLKDRIDRRFMDLYR